eukprot:3666195-Amphidinium_carterae.1
MLSLGTPEHDIVIDVAADLKAGKMQMSLVDNLILVHSMQSHGVMTMAFDIRHQDRGGVLPVVEPQLGCMKGTELLQQLPTKGEDSHAPGPYVLDYSSKTVHTFEIDMDLVLNNILSKPMHDLTMMVLLLQRRRRCRPQLVRTLRQALQQPGSRFRDWTQVFAVLNREYRHAIDAVAQRGPSSTAGSGQTAVSLAELEGLIGDMSILSERQM